jgi:DNA-binding MarR family transcriptional regulator
MSAAGAARARAAAADPESRASDAHHESLRLWLRLLTCTLLIERRIRARLREGFATTLPRFDLMAQLERHPAGLRMGELSQRMMVTGGNVTGITDQLVAEGLVERRPIARDRRAYAVRLTPKGRRVFGTMAVAHERWVIELLSGLDAGERRRLYALLGRVKTTIRGRAEASGAKEGSLR